MDIILYEDEKVSELYPITLSRPAFNIRTGGFTLLEAVKYAFPEAQVYARARSLMHDICRVPQWNAKEGTAKTTLFLNARLAPDIAALGELAGMLKKTNGGHFVVNEKMEAQETLTLSWKMFEHPEEVIFFNRDELKQNLHAMGKKDKLYLGKGVELPKQFSYDTKEGPIVIGDHVVIHPFVVLKGPLVIGESSIINEFSVIRGATTIGPVCKVGGEVEGSVIDGYSNKQHAGFLGESYIGRWVNMGGGTNVSDLKNTYSNISVMGRDSGTQFLGVIIGDFAKTAVNTSIFCGKVIGAASHLYGTITEDVPSFTSHVAPGKIYELPIRLAEKGQKAMAMRRGVDWNDMDTARLEKIFEMTAADREAKKVSKEKISFI